jgi:lipopolysaccharide heptosyltransferase II
VPPIDWSKVKRILVVKLRSIGDTVLSTPSLIALRRHAPEAEIDMLLEDWVAPVLDSFEGVNVIAMGDSFASRWHAAWELRRRDYDVAFNLHGGTTATLMTWLSGATHRFGDAAYQYAFLHNHRTTSPEFWGRKELHSAEQQLAMIGFAGVPVDDLPRTRLTVTHEALRSVEGKLSEFEILNSRSQIAVLHPGTAFITKQWSVKNFARIAEGLHAKGFKVVAIASKAENYVLDQLKNASNVPIRTLDDLRLPEITALISRARIFVGNDSGVAHMAAAVQTPSVVIFGSSNRTHWRPWTDAPNEIVFNPFECQPCPGYTCEAFGDSRCIHSVTVEQVSAAIDQVLSKSA